jgi:hypothetical protein
MQEAVLENGDFGEKARDGGWGKQTWGKTDDVRQSTHRGEHPRKFEVEGRENFGAPES